MNNHVMIGILCHHDLPRLARAVVSACRQWPGNRQFEPVVVVNTKDDAFAASVLRWVEDYFDATRHIIPVHVTECDGTPATGKNELTKVFFRSECEYLLALDGRFSLSVSHALSGLAPDKRA